MGMPDVNTAIEAGGGVATIAVRDRLAASVERRLLPPVIADVAQSQLDAHADELEELRSVLSELGLNQNQVGMLEAGLDGKIATAASIAEMGSEASELGLNQNQVGMLEAALDGKIATAASIAEMGSEAEVRSRRIHGGYHACTPLECVIWWWLNFIPSHYCHTGPTVPAHRSVVTLGNLCVKS